MNTIPRARWYRVGLLLFVIYLIGFVERTNISIAAPDIARDLNLSPEVTGVFLSAFFWGYVLTQVPGGWVASKVGAVRLVCVALVIWGITSVATGLAGSLSMLIVLRVLLGLSEGVVWPAFTVLIARWYPANERSRAANLSMLALPASAVVAAPTGGWMIELWDWHTMFVLQGLPPFLLAVLAWWLLRDDPAEDPRLAGVERDYILESRAAHRAPQTSFWAALARPRVWLLALVYFLWLTGFYSFGLWLPTVVSEVSGSGIGMVGLLSAIPFVVAIGAMMLNARAVDRAKSGPAWFIVAPLLLGGVALLVQHFVVGAVAQFLLLVVVGVGVYGAFGPWWGWVITQAPANQTGPTSGLVNFGGNFGGVVGPVVVGAAGGAAGATAGLYVLGFFLLGAAAVASGLAIRQSSQRVPDQVPVSAEASVPETR